MEIEIVSNDSSSSHVVLNVLNDHHYDDTSTSIDNVICNNSNSESKSKSTHVRTYLRHWEEAPEAMYKTYIFDEFGRQHEKSLCWLYLKDNSMHCSLCEKYRERKGGNGKSNNYLMS